MRFILGILCCVLQVSGFVSPYYSSSRTSKLFAEFKSVALEWAKEQREGTKKYVIIGGGWAGWGAAKALCQSNVDAEIMLLDSLPDPTGATPYLSKTGKVVEAGTRGFWKDYPNIYALCEELGLDENTVFTPYTNSSFYSPDGLEATAPVFAEAKLPFADTPFPMLPSPLGQILATFPLFERIPLSDRASMIGLLIATIDCLGADDEETKEAYDRMTAHDLFIQFGLSPRLVRDFIKPTLLVGLFKPPEELSALVVMELLYYYALAHQDSFDVRWIKNGTVSDSLILPLAQSLMDQYPLTVLGGSIVKQISDSTSTVTYVKEGKECVIHDVDGIVLAVGCKGMKSIVSSSPELAKIPMFASAASLSGIDVISTRIWLDRTVPTRTPANVLSRFEELRGAGGTFFMLDQLQDEEGLIACDFYNAGSLIHLSDQDIIDLLMKELLPSAVPQFMDANVVDSWVGKFPGSVSWFSPGSYTKRPTLNTPLPNLKCAGDWVRMGEREHGAKGLCQERAFVSGMEAANALLGSNAQLKVLPVREDEIQFQTGVKVNNFARKFLPRPWIR